MKKVLKALPFIIIASGVAYFVYADKQLKRIFE